MRTAVGLILAVQRDYLNVDDVFLLRLEPEVTIHSAAHTLFVNSHTFTISVMNAGRAFCAVVTDNRWIDAKTVQSGTCRLALVEIVFQGLTCCLFCIHSPVVC